MLGLERDGRAGPSPPPGSARTAPNRPPPARPAPTEPPEKVWLTLPVRPYPSSHSGPRLNLVLPTVNDAAAFGGVRTALDVFEALAAGDAPRRIITTDAIDQQGKPLLPDYPIRDATLDPRDPRHLVSTADADGNRLAVGPRDVFVATFWTTAELVLRVRSWQERQYGAAPPYFGYVIQDYEPAFYPWSAQYLLASSTYQAPDRTVAMFNTELLREYFHSVDLRFAHETSFEPKLPKELQVPSPTQSRERRIVVYGRPRSPRNAFPLIVDGLKLWAATDPNADGWSVVSAGQGHDPIRLSKGLVMSSVGKLTLGDYAGLLAESAVGVSLMISPHPSYPPLEMAASGMLVLTNRFAQKDLSSWHDNIASLPEASAAGFATALSALCRRFEADPLVGNRGRSRLPRQDGPHFSFGEEVGRLLLADRGGEPAASA